MSTIPPRDAWPPPPKHTAEGAALTRLVVTTLRLHAAFMEAAQDLAAEGDLTPAWWQVLGGVLDAPRPVAEIARRMGMTRQGVQRVADLLVERGLAEYRPNPAHRRSKLVACTEPGYGAIRQVTIAKHPWSDRIGAAVGARELERASGVMERVIAALER
ncbi:MAG: MarR family transcriptional regulator [Solirubrobacterales bacterium]|nr:MarR family transcriptional regulator [Solirubrobacterales bacterium]